MSVKFRIAIAALLSCVLVALPAAPRAEAASYAWSSRYATTGTVTIPQGDTVTLDVDVDLDRLVIDGMLKCGSGDIELRSKTILVGGAIRCGTNGSRHTDDFTITLTGSGSANVSGFGDKYLVVKPTGRLDLHGERRTSWVRLTQSAPAGTTVLQLEDQDWRVGDQIVIAPTDFRPEQAEHATIVAVNGNSVTLDRSLNYLHYCGTESYGGRSITECAEVGLLSRNIVIRGDGQSESSMVGGHTMFHAGSRIRVQEVEFWRMGQVGAVGRYPVHFHLFGDASNSYFRNNSVWRSYNRWVTLHGAQNLRFKDNVGYDTLGHGFYMEDGDEIGNQIVRNLGVLAMAGLPGQLVTPSDDEAAVFWFANPDNHVVKNVAAGATHSGFWYALPERPLGTSPNQHMRPRQTPLDTFRDNVAHSVGFAGLMIDRGERPDRSLETTWYNPVEVPGDENSAMVRPTFSNFTAYKVRHYGFWVRTFSGARFTNLRLADNWRSLYIANIQTAGDHNNTAVITKSLLVGETANVGQPEGWETTGPGGRSLPLFWEPDAPIGGVPFYDGPMHVRQTVFANFQDNGQREAGALTNLFTNAFWVSAENTVSNLSFVNAQKVYLPELEEFDDGDTTTLFLDKDGSVTGNAGWTVNVENPLLAANGSCSNRSGWNAVQCDPTVGHYSIVLNRQDGGWARVDVEREDGASMGFDGSAERDTGVFMMVVSDMTHELTWAESVPTQFNLYVPGFSKNAAGEAARIAFPAPPGNWEFQVNGRYTSTSSLAALDSGSSKWFYEQATGLIHLRLVGDNNWATLR